MSTRSILAVLVFAATAPSPVGCGSNSGQTLDGGSSSGSSSGVVSTMGASDANAASSGSASGASSLSADGSTFGSEAGNDSAAGGGDAGSDRDAPAAGMCTTDPLRTGLTAQQTGVSVDAFDCQILTSCAKYSEPDPMIFKAIIYVESRFDQLAVACPNLPCGTPTGWTAAESGCYGLMQVVPACGGLPNNAGLLPNGHPNMTMNMSSSAWAGSIFNPSVNIDVGISGVAGNRAQVKKQFPGCTEDQYTMMAVGNYNSYGSTKSCTVYNTSYDNSALTAYKQYAAAAGYAAHPY